MKKNIFALLIIFILLIPQIISLSFINEHLFQKVTQSKNLDVQWKNAQFSWFGPQTLESLTWNRDAQRSLTIENIELHIPFLKLLFQRWGSPSIGFTNGTYRDEKATLSLNETLFSTDDKFDALKIKTNGTILDELSHGDFAIDGYLPRFLLVNPQFENLNDVEEWVSKLLKTTVRQKLPLTILVKNFPVSFLLPRAPHDKTISFQYLQKLNPQDDSLLLSLKASEGVFSTDANFRLSSNHLTLLQPATFQLTFGVSALKAINNQGILPFDLTPFPSDENQILAVNLEELRYTFNEPEKSIIKAQVNIPDFTYQLKIPTYNIIFSFDSPSLSFSHLKESENFQLNGMGTLLQTNKKSPLHFELISPFFNATTLKEIASTEDIIYHLLEQVDFHLEAPDLQIPDLGTNWTIDYNSYLVPEESNNLHHFAFSANSDALQAKTTGWLLAEQQYFLVKLDQKGLIHFKNDLNAGAKKTLEIDGQIQLLPTIAGNFEVQGKDIPAQKLFALFPLELMLKQNLAVLTGESISLDLKTLLTSTYSSVTLTSQTTNGTVQFNGNIAQKGITLNSPLIAKLKITREAIDLFAPQFFPIFKGALNSDQPIELYVNDDQFFYPLKDPATQISLKRGQLTLGQWTFNADAQIYKAFDALKLPKVGTNFQVAFTPLYFQIQNGTFTLERVDFLLMNQYPLALWGQYDLIKDIQNLNLGLSGEVLRRSFKLNDIDPEAMVQIPLEGNLKKLKINSSQAVHRITAFAAENQSSISAKLMNGLLSLTRKETFNNEVPEPTTKPLPWKLDPAPQKEGIVSSSVNTVIQPIESVGKGLIHLFQGKSKR